MKYGIDPRRPSSIISLTILDEATLSSDDVIYDKTKILVVVRSAETNITDPNVVSVSTQRVPPRVLKEICKIGHKTKIDKNLGLNFPERFLKAYLIDASKVDSKLESGHNPIIYVVESVLAGKLGLAEPLERGMIHFTASPTSLIVGSVLYENTASNLPGKLIKVQEKEFYQEYQEMCNISVILSSAKYIPKSTASYSHLRWVDINKFMKMVRSKDNNLLLSVFGQQSIGYCVHGLCLTSAYMYLVNKLHVKGR